MSKTTKWALLIIVVLVVAGLWLSVAKSPSREANLDSIKIGAVYAQTGSAAKYGEMSIQAIRDAIEYFKIKNPGVNVDLVIEDSQGDAKQATIAATKLAAVDQVNFSVVGMSAVSAAVAPIADQYKKIFISDAALFGLTKDKTYIFQNFMPDFGLIPVQVNNNKDWKKVAIIYINDDLGNTWSKGIKASIGSAKISELFPFDKATTDFKTDALKIKTYNPDVLIIVGYGPGLNQVLADLALNQVKKPTISYLSCSLPGVLTDKRFSLEGQYSYEYPQVGNDEIKSWALSKGRELNTFYSIAFENALLALNVAKESGNDVEKGLQILKGKQHEGFFGPINFAGKNYTNINLVPTKIINGKCVPI